VFVQRLRGSATTGNVDKLEAGQPNETAEPVHCVTQVAASCLLLLFGKLAADHKKEEEAKAIEPVDCNHRETLKV
jgi:hypothetical protein